MQTKSTEPIKSLKDFCRICGTYLSVTRIHMFHIMPALLRQKVFKILPYNISIDDKLPKDCCYKCIDTLKEFISFVDKSWTIQKTFHRKINIEEHSPNNPKLLLSLPNSWYGSEAPEATLSMLSDQIDTIEPSESDAVQLSPKQSGGTVNLQVVISSDEAESNGQKLEDMSNKERTVDDKHETKNGEASDNETMSIVSGQGSTRSSVDADVNKKKMKKNKSKFHKKNPFCTPRVKRGRFRNQASRRKNQTHFISKRPGLCQLFENGQTKFVQRPAGFKSDSFIMSSIPRVGLIYFCTQCDVIYTSESAAVDHLCKLTGASSVHSCSDIKPSPSNMYACQICDATFPRRVALDHHVTSHLQSDVSDDETSPPRTQSRSKSRAGTKRRYSSDSSADITESESSYDDVIDSDNFIVDDDMDDFIVSDDEERRKKKSRLRNRRNEFLFD